ncbi:MAG: mycothiol system anti-sigma-R factor [Beutenbergiaceae bacterium]
MTSEDCHCEEALERLQAYLDSELARLDANRLQQHIDDCASCLDQVDYERRIRALLRRSCLEKAPEELRVRVRTQLTVIRTTYRHS